MSAGSYGMQFRKLDRLMADGRLTNRWLHYSPGAMDRGKEFIVLEARMNNGVIELYSVRPAPVRGVRITFWPGRQTYLHEGLLSACPNPNCKTLAKAK